MPFHMRIGSAPIDPCVVDLVFRVLSQSCITSDKDWVTSNAELVPRGQFIYPSLHLSAKVERVGGER